MNTDPVNAKYTGQQSTEELSCKELEGDFRSRKKIDLLQQSFTTNQNPCHELPQDCGGTKHACMVWIIPTDTLQSHPSISISINKL